MDIELFLIAARRLHDEVGATDVREPLARLIREVEEAGSPEDREDAVDRIYELLALDEPTRKRFDELLPKVKEERRAGGYGDLAGDPEPVNDRYACPNGDYAWPILDVADPTPPLSTCPYDGETLTFRAAGE
ncbi:hypothetical protein [Streptomyces sp. NPDC002328]|uniref:hypothetical protein n=1 Tax=Streptomyces sp. NPDC002328 TaxID=3364642 RepID=UPI0036ABB299